MARGRHVRRTGLRAWLLPTEPPPPTWRTVHAQSLVLLSDDLRVLQEEVARLRAGTERSTAAQVLAELRADLTPLEVTQTTLGTEWSAGSLSGLLEGATDDSEVTAMWAGRTCLSR